MLESEVFHFEFVCGCSARRSQSLGEALGMELLRGEEVIIEG